MEMTRRQLLLLSLSAVPVAAKGALDWKRETLVIADQLDRLNGSCRLYVIKPEWVETEAQLRAHPDRFFHRYPIRGQAVVQSSDTDLLLRTLSKSLRRGATMGGVYECFDPRHALRIERKGVMIAEVLICFECEQVYFYSKSRPMHGYLSGGLQVFEQVARAYGLPAASRPSRNKSPLTE